MTYDDDGFVILKPIRFAPDLADVDTYPPPGEGIGEFRMVLSLDHHGAHYDLPEGYWARNVNEFYGFSDTLPTPALRMFRLAPTPKMRHIVRVVAAFSLQTGIHWRYLSPGWRYPEMNTKPFVCDGYLAYRKMIRDAVSHFRAIAAKNYGEGDPRTLYSIGANYLIFYDDASYDAGKGSLASISKKVFDYPLTFPVLPALRRDHAEVRYDG